MFVVWANSQDGTAYAVLLNKLAPEVCTLEPLSISDPAERAQAILAQAARIGTRKYITSKDILDGSPNLNLAFVAHLFRTRFVCGFASSSPCFWNAVLW